MSTRSSSGWLPTRNAPRWRSRATGKRSHGRRRPRCAKPSVLADLAMLLSNRRAADEELRTTIDAKTADWGIRVRSVEIRDVRIPVALQDAMSRQAQAERERQARVILSTAEAEIADKFAEAAHTYADNPIALHLRGMNMLYESVKERGGTTIIVPSSAVDSMNLGGVAGVTSLAKRGETNMPGE